MRANVGGEFMESEESFIYNVIRDVFGKIVFPFSSLLMLHGSVVTNGERTFFFAGDKGMGKSTVALQMMQHGYKILSDDSPLVTSKNHACVLSSLDELSVTENTLSLFPTLSAAVSRQREISGKFFVSRNRLDKKMLATGPCEITDFVFLDRKPGANLSITPVSKTDATGDLIKEFMALFPVSLDPTDANRFRAVNSFVFHTLSQLLRNADAYRLEYFNDHLTQIPNLLQDR